MEYSDIESEDAFALAARTGITVTIRDGARQAIARMGDRSAAVSWPGDSPRSVEFVMGRASEVIRRVAEDSGLDS